MNNILLDFEHDASKRAPCAFRRENELEVLRRKNKDHNLPFFVVLVLHACVRCFHLTRSARSDRIGMAFDYT